MFSVRVIAFLYQLAGIKALGLCRRSPLCATTDVCDYPMDETRHSGRSLMNGLVILRYQVIGFCITFAHVRMRVSTTAQVKNPVLLTKNERFSKLWVGNR